MMNSHRWIGVKTMCRGSRYCNSSGVFAAEGLGQTVHLCMHGRRAVALQAPCEQHVVEARDAAVEVVAAREQIPQGRRQEVGAVGTATETDLFRAETVTFVGGVGRRHVAFVN